jgi:diadenosine tetraphosphate (Ap4A) HIT family hydrolase
MGDYCCKLGSAIDQERLLCETSNFFVIPTKGSFGLEGYLLIVPKIHYLGFGGVPDNYKPELDELKKEVKNIIKKAYGLPITIFEHGPRIGNINSGQSVDHAHLHIVPGVDIIKPWAIDLMLRLGEKGSFYRVDRVEGFERAKEIMGSGNSYLYVEDLNGVERMSDQNFIRPSQYFRKMAAKQIGSRKWNWRKYPDKITLKKTLERLAPYFRQVA